MRLDHLLSKEHWPACLVQGLVCSRMSSSRCSRVEHRLFGTAGSAWSVSTHSSWVVMERAGWVLGCLTRCWVLRVRAHRHAISVAGGEASASRPSTPTWWGLWCGPAMWDEPPRCLISVVGAQGVVGADRMLRTEQWTRASLWLKFLRAHGGCLGTRNRRRT